jgi:hypothetical protein
MKTTNTNKKTQTILKVGAVALALGFILVVLKLGEEFGKDVKVKNSLYSVESNSTDKHINKLLTQKEIDVITIVNDITCVNPEIKHKEATLWATKIVNDAYARGYSPFIQAKLIESEGGWERNPKHIMSCDKGMTGTNIRVWGEELKKVGIIKSTKDLENPLVSISASTYIYSYYLNKYHGKTFDALAGYKGYCKVGKDHAREVIAMAKKLKAERYS